MSAEVDPEVERDEKTARSYDRIAHLYDALISVVEPFVSKYRKELLRFSNGAILEVGVGTGNSFKDYPAGSRVVAVDASLGMLRRAKQKTARQDLEAELVCENVQNLSFRDEGFDVIFTSLVFCAVADPVGGLQEMCRVLKKNGVLLMVEHVRSQNSFLGYAMDKLNPLFSRFDNLNRDTVANLRKAGWTVEAERNLLGDVMKAIVATR
jgi:ubiquinone/menaquinone biosynthesis C-methylase UbiE